jgi:predicted metal-dependent enzyme (double-stranded beta helix superfamily)
MFDLERFVADCRIACAARAGHQAVREIVARAVSDPGAILQALGEPRRAGVQTLHRSPELTVLNLVWGPRMSQLPHNHEMWAVIGIYTGREDNIFWRRLPAGSSSRVEAAGAKAICERDAVPLGPDIIHSVLNPIRRLTGAIHVYGGDFFGVPRREWDPEDLAERPYDIDRTLALFEESNRLYPPE